MLRWSRWTIAVMLLLVAGAGFAAAQARRIERVGKGTEGKGAGGRWALVVGVDQYESKDIDPLSGAVADAKAIRDALIKYSEFPESQVVLLVSDGSVKPTRTELMVKLEEIKGAAGTSDLLFFFFAGHGVQVDGQRYLLTYDARISSAALIKSTALPASNLMQELEAMKTAHRVIMIDACRNDPTKPGKQPNVADEAFEAAFTLQPASEGGVRATFLSSSKGQSAYEWTEKRRGFFSYFIEKGLAGEAAQFQKVTVTSLLTYLNEMVPQKVREQKNQLQVPYAKVDGSELILVRSEKLPAAAPSLDKQPVVAATRTIYGVIKDSNGVPLPGATIVVAMAPASRAAGGKAAPQEIKVTADEDGFFKVDGVPPDVEAKVTAAKDAYLPRTLTSSPAEAGKKMTVFLPRAEAAKPTAVADARAAAAPPAVPAAAPPPKAALPPPKPAAASPRPAPPPPSATATVPPKAAAQPVPPAKPAAQPTPGQKPPAVLPAPVAPPPPPVVNLVARADEMARVAYRTFLAEDYKEAENAAREALAADEDNALAHAVLGNALAALGVNTGDAQKTAAAREAIAKALNRDPNQALGHSARGLTLFAEGKAAEARSEFEKAIQLDPRLGTAHSNLGYILSSQNKLPEAERECREAIRLQPESAVPYNCLSDVLFKMGKYKDAVKACREAIGRYELRDRLLGLYYVQLAVAQYQQGKQEEALEAVARAKALGIAQHDAYSTIEKGKAAKKKG